MKKGKAVVVATSKGGMFFGYLVSHEGDTVTLTGARQCVRWVGTHGFLGLAAAGPGQECRIGPAVPRISLPHVTAVVDATPGAVGAWEAEPWR